MPLVRHVVDQWMPNALQHTFIAGRVASTYMFYPASMTIVSASQVLLV